MKAPVRDPVIIESKTLAKIWREIVQKDKHQKRLLQCIELAMERIKTRISIADLAKRHNLTEHKCAGTLRPQSLWREVACLKGPSAPDRHRQTTRARLGVNKSYSGIKTSLRVKLIKVTCDRYKQAVERIRGEEFSTGFCDLPKWGALMSRTC